MRASGEVEPVGLRWRTRGGQGGPRGGQPEVGEDLGDDWRVFDGREKAEATAAASAREDVDRKDPTSTAPLTVASPLLTLPERTLSP
jgi:hypothetical protein